MKNVSFRWLKGFKFPNQTLNTVVDRYSLHESCNMYCIIISQDDDNMIPSGTTLKKVMFIVTNVTKYYCC